MKKNAHTFEFDELLDNVCVRFECEVASYYILFWTGVYNS